MRRQVDYDIVKANTYDGLITQIKSLLPFWQCVGSPIYTGCDAGSDGRDLSPWGYYWFQTICKYEEVKDD